MKARITFDHSDLLLLKDLVIESKRMRDDPQRWFPIFDKINKAYQKAEASVPFATQGVVTGRLRPIDEQQTMPNVPVKVDRHKPSGEESY